MTGVQTCALPILMAVSRSIMSEVRYIVSRTTGADVRSVDVCIDSMVIG